MNSFSTVLADFGAIIGLPNISLDEEQRCDLRFDDIVVNMVHLEDIEKVYICTVLGSIPALDDRRLQSYESLLEANCYFSQTGGGIVGIDKAAHALTYTNIVGTPQLTGNDLAEFMQGYLNTVDALRLRILNADTQGAAALPELNPNIFGTSGFLRV